MIYQIDSKVAKNVGFVGAILFWHIAFWIKKNKANDKNFYDGEYWTYSSVKGFSEYFEDLTESQILQGLKNLIAKGYLKTGDYNKTRYDRTKWYALDKIGKSIYENSQMSFEKIRKPIPDISTDNTPYISKDIYPPKGESQPKKNVFKAPTIEEVEAYGKSKGFTKTDYVDFWEFYENKGWKVGNVKMKSWQLALHRWERNQKGKVNYGIDKRYNQKDTSNNNGSCNSSSVYSEFEFRDDD